MIKLVEIFVCANFTIVHTAYINKTLSNIPIIKQQLRLCIHRFSLGHISIICCKIHLFIYDQKF